MENKSKKAAIAQVEIWKFIFGFTPMAVVKCAIELEIADVLERHGGAMSLSALAAAAGCSAPSLRRIMRFLIHHGFFNLEESTNQYANSPLSRLILKNEAKQQNDSFASFLLMESSPAMLAPWHGLSARAAPGGAPPFGAAHGGADVWAYAARNPGHGRLIDGAMACHAALAVREILAGCGGAVFEGVGRLVDVGGGDGTAVRAVVAACPWVRGINFDLPHVVAAAPPPGEGVEHVGGDMFEKVPEADAAFIMWVLHDWSDEDCIRILGKCREAVKRKVIIAEAVIEEGGEDKYSEVRLALDMVMMAHTDKGKERSVEEWDHVIKGAGFSSYTVTHIGSIISVIEAYP